MVIFYLFVFLVTTHANEWYMQYDLSFGFEYATGSDGLISLFDKKHVSNGKFRTPFEAKIFVVKQYPINISVNSGSSFYFQDTAFHSLNISAGISIYLNKNHPLYISPMALPKDIRFYMSLYPIYDFPFIDFLSKDYLYPGG
jgi:hypothetical protein